MRDDAETALRQAVADGVLSAADLQNFGHTDYAGVARVVKLDAGLSEVVVAVKLQEIDGAALLAMEPADFASALGLAKPQQAKRLEAFLSAIKRVAENPTGTAQEQQQPGPAATAPAAAAPAAAISKKKRAASKAEASAELVAVKRKQSAASKGLQAPRVSGLKRPPQTLPAAVAAAAAGSSAALAPTVPTSAAVEAAGVSPELQQSAEPNELHEAKAGDAAAAAAAAAAAVPEKLQQQKKIKDRKSSREKKVCGQEQQKQQQEESKPKQEKNKRKQQKDNKQKQEEEKIKKNADARSERREKLLAWGSSVVSLKETFEAKIHQEQKNKKFLFSISGFAEGAGLQHEMPGLVRRLGSLGGFSVFFEWKPQNPEKITHLICSDELERPTVKVYFALASGALLLTEEFLREAKRNNAWPDPRQFQRVDFPSVENRKNSRWLLRGLPICVDGPCRSAALSKQQLHALVAALGGRLADEASASLWLLEDAETLRRRQARGLWGPPQEAKGVPRPAAVSTQWLLDCIKKWQCMQPEPHMLSLFCQPQNNKADEGPKATLQKMKQKSTKIEKENMNMEERENAANPQQPSAPDEETPPASKRRKRRAKEKNAQRPSEGAGSLPGCEALAVAEAACSSAASKEHQQEGQEQQPEQKQGEHVSAVVDAGHRRRQSKTSKKRLPEKGPQSGPPKKQKACLPPADAAGGRKTAHQLKSHAATEAAAAEVAAAGPGSGPLAAEEEEENRNSLGAEEATANACSAAKEAAAVEGDGESQDGLDDELLPASAVSDWGVLEEVGAGNDIPSPQEHNSACEETISFAAEPPAEGGDESAGSPQRESAAATSQSAAAPMEFFEPPAAELAVADLFGPDEEEGEAAEYNFDFDEHSSSAQKESAGVEQGRPH